MNIYKYLCEARFDFFQHFRLRFSQPTALNDPYECLPSPKDDDAKKYMRDLVDTNKPQLLRRMGPGKSLADRKRQERELIRRTRRVITDLQKNPHAFPVKLLEIWKQSVNKHLGILSLTNRSNSPVMWSHYADRHKGFVIEFDGDHEFFKRQPDDPQDVGTIELVEYCDTRMEVKFDGTSVPKQVWLRKSLDWEYEQEVRLIRSLSKAAQVLPGDPPVHLFDVPKECIVSVIFGMNCDNGKQEDITASIRSDTELTKVRLYKSRLDLKSFNMAVDEIKR